jgi:hypothetical protein
MIFLAILLLAVVMTATAYSIDYLINGEKGEAAALFKALRKLVKR